MSKTCKHIIPTQIWCEQCLREIKAQAKLESLSDVESEVLFITWFEGANKGRITIPTTLWNEKKAKYEKELQGGAEGELDRKGN